MSLPRAFVDRPIAHRGLHDVTAGRAENSTKAFAAAIDASYGIELDVQLSSDGEAMAFHDYDLGRLTAEQGPVAQRTAAELGQIALLHDGGGIPTLAEVLKQVDGQVPMLIEIKDQDGAMGPDIGKLEAATARALTGYHGAFAVMSFNPYSVAAMAELLPDAPRGIVTSAYTAEDWPTIPAAVRDHLRGIPDYDRTASTFISHDRRLGSSARDGFKGQWCDNLVLDNQIRAARSRCAPRGSQCYVRAVSGLTCSTTRPL